MAIDRHRMIKGMIEHYPFVIKNFNAYFRNLYRRRILKWLFRVSSGYAGAAARLARCKTASCTARF